MPKLHPGEGDPTMGQADRPENRPMSEEEKFVAENKKELFALRKVVNEMHPKYRIVLDTFDFHGNHGGIYSDLKAAGADVELDEESEMPDDVKVEQLKQLEDEAFAIIKQKLGIEREDAIKMLTVFHEF